MVPQQTFGFNKTEHKTLDDLDAKWDDCRKCNLRRLTKKVTHGVGNRTDPTVMVIGQYPTEAEVADGIPFQGRGGNLIKEFFDKCGIPEADIYYTNVIKCPSFGTKVIPKANMQECSPYLDDEIAILNPQLIVAMGTNGSKRLLQRVKPKPKTLADARSKDYEYEGHRLLIVANPVAVIYAIDAFQAIEKQTIYDEDVERVKKMYGKIKGIVVQEVKKEKDSRDIFALYDDVVKCTKCHLGNECEHRVFGNGPLNADIMIVGEGPGRQEDDKGNPFVGPAGRRLEEAIAEASRRFEETTKASQIRRSDIYLANTVKCRPTNKDGGDRAPNPDERASCEEYLTQQINIVKPRVILAVGRITMESLWRIRVDRVGVRQNTRAPYYNDPNVTVIGAWHPSYVLRQDRSGRTQTFEELVAAILSAFTLAYGK